MAKLIDSINKKPIPFEVDGTTLWAKRLTVQEVKDLHKDIQALQDKLQGDLIKRAEDISVELTPEEEAELEDLNGYLVMYLFRSVIVGEDGTLFEEFQSPDVTYSRVCEFLPISLLQKLPQVVMETIAGNNSGN